MTNIIAKENSKLNGINNMEDHNLLIELRTEMRSLRAEVKELGTGIIARVSELEKYKVDTETWREKNKDVLSTTTDHETRIRINEKNITKILTWGSAALIGLQIAQFLVSKFL